MCGFLFHFSPGWRASEACARTRDALGRLRHRGPDEQGFSRVGSAYFAHARLSILDLDDSHQPMQSPEGRYTLVFNGEIYNYQDLRRELISRWAFRTSGDTEVLLAGLILEGERFLGRLHGMWSFALWDAETESLLMSRDRMGKKPLFYQKTADGIVCGSELPALRCISPDTWEEDLDSTADYFRFGFCLPGYTAWKGVFEVLPGHWFRWNKTGSTQQSYWELPLPDSRNLSGTDIQLREALFHAVEKRLIADVEVGAFLSGGIDSSLVCAMAQARMPRPLKSFTIGFDDPAFDESGYAERVARHIGTEHYCETFEGWQGDVLTALLQQHVGQPFADVSLLPTSMVSRVAAQEVKVALSGDGADELFGGYQRYQARLILRWYTRLPSWMRGAAERAIRSLPEPAAHHSRSLVKKAHLFVDIVNRHGDEQPYTAPLLFHPMEYEALFPDLAQRGHTAAGLPSTTHLDDLQQMLYRDALVYLPQDILTKVDRASMAHGLEVRAPFLDHKVVETAFSRRASAHLSLGKGKRWLRRAFSDLLPGETWRRRKQGFGVPVHQWFRGAMGTELGRLLEACPGPIDARSAKRLLADHRAGRRDNGYRLWMLYVYLLFSRPL